MTQQQEPTEHDLKDFEKVVKQALKIGLGKKAGTLKLLVAEIDRLIDLNYTHTVLVETMNKAGLEFTMGTYHSTLTRIKLSEKEKKPRKK